MLAVALAVALWPVRASGADEGVPPGHRSPPDPDFATRLTERGPWLHLLGAVAVGRGLRLNNPYRLETRLGDTDRSLSLSATYLDLAVGCTFARRVGPEHGPMVHFAEALEGIAQDVLTPGYVALWRWSPRWLVYGRAGVPVVLRPDATIGMEAAVGAVFHLTAGIGLTAEVIGSIFYGAATYERDVTTIPMLAMQLGVFLDYEVLP